MKIQRMKYSKELDMFYGAGSVEFEQHPFDPRFAVKRVFMHLIETGATVHLGTTMTEGSEEFVPGNNAYISGAIPSRELVAKGPVHVKTEIPVDISYETGTVSIGTRPEYFKHPVFMAFMQSLTGEPHSMQRMVQKGY